MDDAIRSRAHKSTAIVDLSLVLAALPVQER